jgi:hypothetical protein
MSAPDCAAEFAAFAAACQAPVLAAAAAQAGGPEPEAEAGP